MELAKEGIKPPLLMGCWPYFKLAKKFYLSRIGVLKCRKEGSDWRAGGNTRIFPNPNKTSILKTFAVREGRSVRVLLYPWNIFDISVGFEHNRQHDPHNFTI